MSTSSSAAHFTLAGFIVRYIAYAILSLGAFILTSGGWTTLFYIVILWIPYAILLGVIVIIAILQYSQKKRSVTIAKTDFFILLGCQAMALLFNIGDCGDADSTFFFLEKVLSTTDVCDVQLSDGILQGVMIVRLVSLCIYGILLSFLVLRSVATATARPTAGLPFICIR